MTLFHYTFCPIDVTDDPMCVTGSWALAPTHNDARNILLAYLGWGPAERKQIRQWFDERYTCTTALREPENFAGSKEEWILAVRSDVFGEHRLCRPAPKAIRYVRPQPAPVETKSAGKPKREARPQPASDRIPFSVLFRKWLNTAFWIGGIIVVVLYWHAIQPVVTSALWLLGILAVIVMAFL